MTGEVWKDAVGFPGYRVSSMGRVSGKLVPILKPTRDHNGYGRVGLSVEGIETEKKVATLVCEAFHGPRPKGLVCCHNDGDSTNDAEDNLRWATQQENSDDKERHGTTMRHDAHYRAVLTVDKVREIKAMHTAARRGMKKVPRGALGAIAAQFGVGTKAISKVMRGENWRGVA